MEEECILTFIFSSANLAMLTILACVGVRSFNKPPNDSVNSFSPFHSPIPYQTQEGGGGTGIRNTT